jgi:MinD superfamily P-loop ATPase
VKELVIIGGKGGTGKTSLAASFAVPADRIFRMQECLARSEAERKRASFYV